MEKNHFKLDANKTRKLSFRKKNMWIRIRKKKKMNKNLHMQLQEKKCKAFDTLWNEGWTVEQLKSYIKYGRKNILMSWLFKNVFLSFVLNALFHTSVSSSWRCPRVQQVWITIVQQFNVMAYFHYRDLLARSALLCLEIYLGLVDHWQDSYSFYLKLFCTIKG